MRIAMAGQTWGPENGPGVFTRRLAQRLGRDGHTVMAFVPGRSMRSRFEQEGEVAIAAIAALSLAPFYPEVRVTPAPFRSVQRALERFEPDVVHIQDHYPLSRAVVRAARQMRIPIVATNHFIPANMRPHMPLLGRLAITERFLWKNLVAVFDQAGMVTTPTETAAAILRPHLRTVRVCAISCGIDIDAFRVPTPAERATARAQWQIATDDVLFTYVGRLDREKRVDLLIEAMSRVRNGAIRLIVAGRGRQLDELRGLARKSGAAGRIMFCGFAADSDLMALLRASDFFAMPSDVELQSIATLEAMATGLPVLAANARALPELVENGVNGALFDAGNAAEAAEKMEILAAAPRARWPEMSQASRARAAHHSIDATVAAYEEIYEGVRRANT